METIGIYLGAFACIFGTIGVLAVFFASLYARKLFRAPGRLGAQMGLSKILARRGRQQGDWFGGEYEGRPFALTYVTQKVRGMHVSTDTRTQAQASLRIAIPVFRAGAGTVDMRRRVQATRTPRDFEDAFLKTEGIEKLGPRSRAALWAFMGEHNAIRIKDWAGHPRQTLPLGLGFQGEWVLVHDHYGLEHRAEVAWRKLDALHRLATVIESERAE